MKRLLSAFGTVVTAAALSTPVHAQTVIVSETPFSSVVASMTSASATTLDGDSVLIAYTEGPFVGTTQIGTGKFVVVNSNTGAIEVPPVPLQYGFRVPSAAALDADTALIVARDDNVGATRGFGFYYVVDTSTGAILRGPTLFTSSGTGWEFRIAVADPTTVLIAHRADGINRGAKFTVIDPTTGTVKVPERDFDPDPIDTFGIAALDARRVAMVYGRPSDVPLPSAFTIVDAAAGSTLAGPRPLEGFRYAEDALRVSSTDVLFSYRDPDPSIVSFARLNTRTGTVSAPTSISADLLEVSPTVLGNNVAFFEYSALTGVTDFVVHDMSGPLLIPATMLTLNASNGVASTAIGCRILTAYSDSDDAGKGKFQVRDFSNICHPVVADVTANGMQGPIDLIPGESLEVRLSFDSGNVDVINPAEVYIGVLSPSGLFWLDGTALTFVSTVTAAYVGPVPSFAPARLINLPDVSAMAPGTWLWFMIVDNDDNGIPDGTFYDVLQTVIH